MLIKKSLICIWNLLSLARPTARSESELLIFGGHWDPPVGHNLSADKLGHSRDLLLQRCSTVAAFSTTSLRQSSHSPDWTGLLQYWENIVYVRVSKLRTPTSKHWSAWGPWRYYRVYPILQRSSSSFMCLYWALHAQQQWRRTSLLVSQTLAEHRSKRILMNFLYDSVNLTKWSVSSDMKLIVGLLSSQIRFYLSVAYSFCKHSTIVSRVCT